MLVRFGGQKMLGQDEQGQVMEPAAVSISASNRRITELIVSSPKQIKQAAGEVAWKDMPVCWFQAAD
jgi:hypothetical protein